MTHFGIFCPAKTGHLNAFYSKLAQFSQIAAEFDFPRQHLPQCFHFTGLYHDSYKNTASSLQEAIQRAGGVRRASDIVELATSKKKLVLATV
ncbi:hypothetical protein [Anabaena sp. AL93]|uniref:hypothetical protein n=1 Tax=Anabaena sp. AL93 TaxID=1678133 RepID=UPI0007FE2F97|nr:hypothetical protein [Anabaena sp. AL93]OBQ22660.1 MAG: hypothetical protein AN486_01995 [Anabaena sp. AL93]